jgi:hypothetical protein
MAVRRCVGGMAVWLVHPRFIGMKSGDEDGNSSRYSLLSYDSSQGTACLGLLDSLVTMRKV